MQDNLAIYVKQAFKSYEGNKILDNFTMSVEKGTIYGLLGASGCGKTTLLNCIIGRRDLDDGEMLTLGKVPGTPHSGVPGPQIGYMPQDMALVPEFTVRETIYFFGRLANMRDEDIFRRFYDLSRFLELPPNKRHINECSGGEQRRISLASAIVHEPELLILDEPTVGVDSVLRNKIWSYLIGQIRQGITVVMTTHYIEECRSAHKVGLMRNGRLLAEYPPQTIMSLMRCDTLEQAFLQLCVEDDQGTFSPRFVDHVGLQNDIPSTSNSMQSFDTIESSEDLVSSSRKSKHKQPKTFLGINSKRLFALVWKNTIQFFRNKFGLVLFGLLPITQTLFLLYCIGGDIKGLYVGIINEEVPGNLCLKYNRNLSAIPDDETYNCEFRNLSCRYLEYLNHPMIYTVEYDSPETATDDLRHGKLTGFLQIPHNFTKNYQKRVQNILDVDEYVLKYGNIHAILDMSNKATGGELKHKLIELFLDFQEDIFKDCHWNERLGKSPINEEYLFGKKHDPFLIFMIPGLLLSFGFYFGVTMSSQLIVSEKCEGVWDRSLASGVTTAEIAFGHLLVQVGVSLIHGVAPILLTLYVKGIEYHGSVLHMIFISLLQNICGLALGFWISVVSQSQTQAHYIATGIMFPTMIMCGIMWPLEGLPCWLQIVSKCLPITLPVVALRNVIRKGLSFWTIEILLPNLIPFTWTVSLIVISLMRIKSTK